jgi:DinB superfamily
MDAQEYIRKQLLDLLKGGNAHMDFDEAVARFPMEAVNSSPPGSDYTPWRLLEHMRIAQWDILEFVHNPQHVSPPWPAGYWPAEGESADPQKWDQTLQSFHADQRAMQDLVENPQTDLLGELPHAPGYTILREVLVLSDHNAYHMGEFAMMREMMNTWVKC